MIRIIKDQSQSATGIVSPVPVVRPGGQYTDKHEDRNDDQYYAHVILPNLINTASGVSTSLHKPQPVVVTSDVITRTIGITVDNSKSD
jgi:hypothetical protein